MCLSVLEFEPSMAQGERFLGSVLHESPADF